MSRKEIEPFVIEELTIVLADTVRNRIDSAIGYNLPVLVEFEYYPGDEDEAPMIYQMKVKASDGGVLQGERVTLTLWHGYELTDYLNAAQESAIEQAMLDRMEKRASDARDESLVDAGIAAREDRSRPYGW